MSEHPTPDAFPSAKPEDPATVPGERSVASVNHIRPMQSRVTSALAILLFGGLALAGLAWYYSSALTRSHRPQAQTARAVQQRAEGEMSLPSLGPLPVRDNRGEVASRVLEPLPPDSRSLAVAQSGHRAGIARSTRRTEKTPLERQLGGPVMVRATSIASGRSATAATTSGRAGVLRGVGTPTNSFPPRQGGADAELGDYLHSTSTDSARAHRLGSQRLLLAKGTTVDCTLLSAIDSTLPGFTKCVTATDTWSADGSVILLERGSQLFGETRGQVQAGQNRLFIVWSEARTPDGVVVPLASPGTDPLGRAGVTGQIDRHFGSRFGSAILISVIDGVVQGVAHSQNRGGVVVNPSGSRDVATEILRETMRVRPTLRKNQGDRVAVLVARDVDFRGVYALAAE